MTVSASTPRLRVTLWAYVLMVLATAVNQPSAAAGGRTAALLWLFAGLAIGASALGRIWCSVFIAGRKDAQLVTTGPYALCRHPLYSLSLLAGLGLGAATRSLTLCLAILGLLLALFWRATLAEEQFLVCLHGDAYHRYRERTPRFWPSGTAYSVPAELQIRPPVLWKAFLDAGSMLLLLALVAAASLLQQARVLPAWLHLP